MDPKYWQAVKTAEDPETLLEAMAVFLDADADRETHGTVIACLRSAAEHCRMAALDYYVSTK